MLTLTRPAAKLMSLVIALVGFINAALPASGQSGASPVYVGSAKCTTCHSGEAAAWEMSHHALAWTLPGDGHLLGNFEDASLVHDGIRSRMTRSGSDYIVETEGPDGRMASYPVVGVAGIAPLQQYLLETETGRLQSWDIVWDVEKKRWYDLYPDDDLAPGDGLHWTGPYKTWNARCAECHATGYVKAYDPATRHYDSRQAEIGVGCEACHGPASEHLEWADEYDDQATAELTPAEIGLVTDFRAPQALIQQCAGCHSRRETFFDGNPEPGTPFHDAYNLSLLRQGLYHPDGQILDEVYVFGSFLQSKMNANGVACTNCHDPHSARLVAEGNAVCTQCHSIAGNTDFPSLPLKVFDGPEHHFHREGSPGAQCTNCHMPERTYMGTDGRRDHSFRIPRPDLASATRSPDACTDCHDDKDAAWAARKIEEWYPDSSHRGPQFGEVFAAARVQLQSQTEALIGIVEHEGLPGIVRASALELLSEMMDEGVATRLASQLNDPDPLVRVAAVSAQSAAGIEERMQRLVPRLSDDTRAVRIRAARVMLDVPAGAISAEVEDALRDAMTEWQSSLMAKADFPETQMVLGGVGLTTRNFRYAVSAFEEVVRLDPQIVQGWTMIARIKDALGDPKGAADAIDRGLKKNPGDIELTVMRGEMALP